MLKHRNGFTLMEIMIVMAIIVAAVSMALPYMTNRNAERRKFLREMTVLTRELHTKSKLHGAIYRLVIEMPPANSIGQQQEQKIWVEKSNSKMALNEVEELAAKKRDEEPDKEKPKDPKGFEVDTGILKKPRIVPSGLIIDAVELTRVKAPIRQGKAFIHFLPQGLVDEAAIHIKGQGTQSWTISIHPLTGQAETIAKPLPLKEIKSQ